MHTRTFIIILSALSFLFSPVIALVVEKRGSGTSVLKPKPAPEILTFKNGVRPDAQWKTVYSMPLGMGDSLYKATDPQGNMRFTINHENKGNKLDYIFYTPEGYEVGSGKRRDGKDTYSTKPYKGFYSQYQLFQ